MARLPTEPVRPFLSPDARGNGAPAAAGALSAKARALTSGVTGVRFEPLVLFAEPLFDHYHLDPTSAFELGAGIVEPDEMVVTALEAARVLWAYFSLPAEARDRAHAALADYLLGPSHAPEDEIDLEFLLERMEEQWNMLTPEDRAIGEGVESRTLGFDELLVHPAFAHGEESTEPRGFGPHELSEVEAQALFAQPLLDGAREPDEMEAALERAHAYWELARMDRHAREAHIPGIARELATSKSEQADLEAEAREMMARFDELFPDHTR